MRKKQPIYTIIPFILFSSPGRYNTEYEWYYIWDIVDDVRVVYSCIEEYGRVCHAMLYALSCLPTGQSVSVYYVMHRIALQRTA